MLRHIMGLLQQHYENRYGTPRFEPLLDCSTNSFAVKVLVGISNPTLIENRGTYFSTSYLVSSQPPS